MAAEEAARERLDSLGYDAVEVLALKNDHAVFRDTAGNVRVKNLKDTRFRGLVGAFYDNHTGKQETALEAALNAIPGDRGDGSAVRITVETIAGPMTAEICPGIHAASAGMGGDSCTLREAR